MNLSLSLSHTHTQTNNTSNTNYTKLKSLTRVPYNIKLITKTDSVIICRIKTAKALQTDKYTPSHCRLTSPTGD